MESLFDASIIILSERKVIENDFDFEIMTFVRLHFAINRYTKLELEISKSHYQFDLAFLCSFNSKINLTDAII